MYFLVDYENVRNVGLEGTEFLAENDTLIIYYSDACKNIKRHHIDKIVKSGCNWEIVKLKRIGKNAIDYYIATSVGEIMALNPNTSIAIISNDKGFHAVKDYWGERIVYVDQLVQTATIFLGMCNGRDDSGRRRVLQYKNATLTLEEEYIKYMERRRIIGQLEDCFKGSIYENKLHEIKEIIYNEPTPKAKYLASLKTFGRKDGMDIYRKIKFITLCCPETIKDAV